jgi:hypothetical protein
MGEATLDHTLQQLSTTLIAEVSFAVVLHRVAELALDLGLPAAAVELRFQDDRGRPLEQVRVGMPAGGPADAAVDHLAVALPVSGGEMGTMTFFAREPGAFTSDDVDVAERFAALSAVVVANARAYWDLHEVASGLQAAMQSRAVIEQAKGKLMALEGCTADEAFTMLARASQRENVKLRELARRLIEPGGRL